MILTDIQTYLGKQKRASLADLALHFRTDADALRPMLERLSRKGRVRRLDGKKCRGCTSCAPTSLEVYEWIN